MVRIAMENGGEKKPVFDSNDVVFYALPEVLKEIFHKDSPFYRIIL